MCYILNNPEEVKKMLVSIGLSSLENLFDHIPSKIRANFVGKDIGCSEQEVRSFIENLARKNRSLEEFTSFLGGGCYDHYIPSALGHLLSRTEFYTAYTPYQPECSQGTLQALYEYQSYICILTGMDVTNASLYDGATALAEAALMSLRINKREKVVVGRSVHPEYRDVLLTYLSPLNIDVRVIDFDNTGRISLSSLEEYIDARTSCIIIQNPNFFGVLEDIDKVCFLARKKDILVILIVNPHILALLKPPSEYGVDIVCGDGGVLGNPPYLGGTTFGFLATKTDFLRQLPGRIVGRTVDVKGRVAYCLTLQTREQHIRREKATSNICSNHSLNTIGAAIYLALLGKEGIKKVALYSLNIAHYLSEELAKIKGVNIRFSSSFFNEFVWEISEARKVLNALYLHKILAGVYLGDFYPEMKNCILTACTEKIDVWDIHRFLSSLKEVLHG